MTLENERLIEDALVQISLLAFQSGKEADIETHQGAEAAWEGIGMHSQPAQVLFNSGLDMNRIVDVWAGAYLLGWESVSREPNPTN